MWEALCAEGHSGQWVNYSFFISRRGVQGLPSVSAGQCHSQNAPLFSRCCRAALPAGLRCASVNCSAPQSLSPLIPPFITPIPHVWWRHLPQGAPTGASKVGNNKFGSLFPASFLPQETLNQKWPTQPDLTGHWPGLSTPHFMQRLI